MSHIRPKSLPQWICYAVALFCFVQAGRAVLVPTEAPVVQAAITPTPRYIEVPIEQVRAGDLVVSRNDHTGELVSQPVAQAFSRISNHLRLVETENLSTGERQIIETTNEHPFWVTDLGWVNAGELQPGQTLEDVTGQAVVVLATRYEPHAEGLPVFNFEVTDTHTYFVKAPTARGPPIWVHNATCGEVLVDLDVNLGARLAAESSLARRAYLNEKFGRTGNLNLDINTRGLAERLRSAGFHADDATKISRHVANGGDVALVGGHMSPRVRDARVLLDHVGINVRHWSRSPDVFNSFSNPIEANRSWLRYWNIDRQALTIDIGSAPGFRPGAHYSMEQRSLYRHWQGRIQQPVQWNPGF